MEHITLPRDQGTPLVIKIPYFASHGPAYDGQGWASFPQRHGYGAPDEVLSHDRVWQHVPPTTELKSFVQSWLYFGLLQEILCDTYRREDFICQSQDGGRSFISTTHLKSRILQRRNAMKIWPPHIGWNIGGSPRSVSLSEQQRMGQLRETAWWQARQWEIYADGKDREWADLALSIFLLIEALWNVTASVALDGSPVQLNPSNYPRYVSSLAKWNIDAVREPNRQCIRSISEEMVASGEWCIHQIRTICQSVSFTTLIYLGNLRRYARPGVDHNRCQASSKCIAYNVDDTRFEGGHCLADCSCDQVVASRQDLAHILETGDVPVLACQRTPNGKLSIGYERTSKGLKYIAVSHVWADGLASPYRNSLPFCQLDRVLQRVEDRYAKHYWLAAVLIPFAWLVCAPRPRPKPDKIYIWLDVYCIPVLDHSLPDPQPESDFVEAPEVSETPAEQARRLKMTAIARMNSTYSSAESVIVLDREIACLPPNTGEVEFLSRIATSVWNTRCWTYSEGQLAPELVFECADGLAFKTETIEWRPKDKWRYMGTTQRFDGIANIMLDVKSLLPLRHANPRGNIYFSGPVEPASSPALPRDNKLASFVREWNHLADRTTTKWEDTLGILANLLHLDAATVLALDSRDQMRAILATQENLPLSLLFTRAPSSRRQASNSEGAVPKDQWIPTSPQDGRQVFHPYGYDMSPVSNGYLIDIHRIYSYNFATILQLPISEGSRWAFNIAGLPTTYRLGFSRAALDANLTTTRRSVLILIDKTRRAPASLGRGALLLPVRGGSVDELKCVYVCPLRWNTRPLEDGESPAVEAVMLGPERERLLIVTAES